MLILINLKVLNIKSNKKIFMNQLKFDLIFNHLDFLLLINLEQALILIIKIILFKTKFKNNFLKKMI